MENQTKKKIKYRCQQLNENGRQCRNWADKMEEYHGDPEIYSNYGSKTEFPPTWVKVHLCKKHRIN